jgi:LPS-assembly lipoprotein
MIARRSLVLSLAALTAGCGFHPVYGTGEHGQAALAKIFVKVIPDRNGQLLRQALQAKFEGEGSNAEKRYILSVFYFDFGQVVGTQQDNFGTRSRNIATAGWALNLVDDPAKKVTGGTARSVDGYNLIDEQFFYQDLADEAVQRRLAQAVADQIALALSVYFDKHPPAQG